MVKNKFSKSFFAWLVVQHAELKTFFIYTNIAHILFILCCSEITLCKLNFVNNT